MHAVMWIYWEWLSLGIFVVSLNKVPCHITSSCTKHTAGMNALFNFYTGSHRWQQHTFRAWEIWMKSKNLKPTAAYMYNASNTQLHLWLALCNVWLSGLLSYGMCSCNLIPSTSWQQNHSKNRRCTCLHVFYCSPYFIVGIIIQSVFRCVPSTVAQI